MFNKRIVSVIAVFLFFDTGAYGWSEGIEEETVSGVVVAYDTGLEIADGSCRQTIIVRTAKNIKHKKPNKYIIVRYENSCMKLIPERLLKKGSQYRFVLSRNMDCDAVLEDLLYIRYMGPTGGKSEIPRVQLIVGADAKEIPTGKKLPCYAVRPGGFAPPLKQRLVAGVVAFPEGRPVVEAYVFLRYSDSDSDLMTVKTNDQGHFTLWAYEGFEYTVRVLAAGVYGEPVQIPANGEVKPLRLVIK